MKLAAATLLLLFLAQAVAAKQILVVGDSLTCGPFGANLVKNLERNRSNSVTVYCEIGSGPANWVTGARAASSIEPETMRVRSRFDCQTCSGTKGCSAWIQHDNLLGRLGQSCNVGATNNPKIADLLKKKKYDEVIIGLGTNSMTQPLDPSYRKLLKLIKGHTHSCTWIGPPHFDPTKGTRANYNETHLEALYTSLGRAVREEHSCKLVDSRPATAHLRAQDTVADGVHYQSAKARDWADDVFENSGPVQSAEIDGETPTTD